MFYFPFSLGPCSTPSRCIILFSIEATLGRKIGPCASSVMDFFLYDCWMPAGIDEGRGEKKQHPVSDWGTDTETWHLLLPTIFHWVKFSKSTATEISSESWSEVSNMTGSSPSSHRGRLIYRSQTQELCWSDPRKTWISHPWITCMEAWVAQSRAEGTNTTGRKEMEGQGKGRDVIGFSLSQMHLCQNRSGLTTNQRRGLQEICTRLSMKLNYIKHRCCTVKSRLKGRINQTVFTLHDLKVLVLVIWQQVV